MRILNAGLPELVEGFSSSGLDGLSQAGGKVTLYLR